MGQWGSFFVVLWLLIRALVPLGINTDRPLGHIWDSTPLQWSFTSMNGQEMESAQLGLDMRVEWWGLKASAEGWVHVGSMWQVGPFAGVQVSCRWDPEHLVPTRASGFCVVVPGR